MSPDRQVFSWPSPHRHPLFPSFLLPLPSSRHGEADNGSGYVWLDIAGIQPPIMDINDSAQSSGSSLLAKRAAEGSNGDVVQVEHEAAAQMTKRPRLDGESKVSLQRSYHGSQRCLEKHLTKLSPPCFSRYQPEDARVHSLRGDESEPASPSNSRQSSPSMQSPNTSLATPAADKSFGGAKRRGDDGRKALPRNIDR